MVGARWRRLRGWLTLEGRLSVEQAWALLPGPALLLAGMLFPYRWLFFVAYVYLALTGAAYLWARSVGPRVRLRRRLRSEWAQVGDELEEQWELTNAAWLPLVWLEIEDASTLPGYTGRRVAAAGGRERVHWLTSATCEQRGVYTLGPLEARLGDPLGMFSYAWHEESARQIVIYPPLVQLPRLQIPQGQRGGLARAELLQQHVTPSVGGLREYAPGDLPSRIHWPTVARTERLMVKEFDQERAGALWIALDLHSGAYQLPHPESRQPERAQEGRGGERERRGERYGQSSAVLLPVATNVTDSPLELAVVLACSLAAQALAEGRAVGLLADDGRRRRIVPGQGPRQLWRILSELVDVQATGALPLGDVLWQGRVGAEAAGAALAVVTPALDGGWLPALAGWQRGRPGGALALLVARRAALAQPLEGRLAALGIAAHTFEPGQPLPLLNPPKPRATLRVSPLGKIVRG